MKKLKTVLKKYSHIMFLDFEGAQRTGEMIALGAVLCTLRFDGRIRKKKKPLKIFVQAHSYIGDYVIKLTHITPELLKHVGVSFKSAMESLKKYAGMYFKKTLFVTFGKNDMRILHESLTHNIDGPKDICEVIFKNYFDYEAFIGQYVKDESGNAMSLIHLCELYNLKLAEPAHDPANDALNLANLYSAFIDYPEITRDAYSRLIVTNGRHESPLKRFLARLQNGESLTIKDLDNEIEKEFE